MTHFAFPPFSARLNVDVQFFSGARNIRAPELTADQDSQMQVVLRSFVHVFFKALHDNVRARELQRLVDADTARARTSSLHAEVKLEDRWSL